MQKNDRTLWTEGMFLGPQHFQQHDRFLLNTVALVVKGMGAHAYGVIDFEVDAHAFSEGKFALTKITGLFPDGTPFNLPEDGELPAPYLSTLTAATLFSHWHFPLRTNKTRMP